MDLQMRGLKAAVTGATKGIGRAIAEMLAEEGVDLAICARNGVQVRTAAAELKGRGIGVIGTELDVADPAALKGWIDAAAVEFGGLDILVCNVSALAVGDTPESWEKSFRVDVMHTVNAVAAAMPYLEKSRSPSIIIVSSVSGFEVDFAAGSYGASKATLIHYGKGLSQQLAAKGIRVNVVSPGNTYIEGGIWNQIEQGNPALFQQTVAANPTGKLGSAREVAYGVVFLASPVASRISGTNLIIDGALTRAV